MLTTRTWLVGPRGFHSGIENDALVWPAFWAEACGEDELDGRWTARVSGFAVGFLHLSYHSFDLYRVRTHDVHFFRFV